MGCLLLGDNKKREGKLEIKMDLDKYYDGSRVTCVIPVYKTEKHLSTCLDSIKNQVSRIIVIDDCSPDFDCWLKDNELPDNAELIRLDENKGVGYARDLGIQKTNTYYIMFLDSDIKANSSFVEDALVWLEADQADAVFSRFNTRRRNLIEKLRDRMYATRTPFWTTDTILPEGCSIYDKSFLENDTKGFYRGNRGSNAKTVHKELNPVCRFFILENKSTHLRVESNYLEYVKRGMRNRQNSSPSTLKTLFMVSPLALVFYTLKMRSVLFGVMVWFRNAISFGKRKVVDDG